MNEHYIVRDIKTKGKPFVEGVIIDNTPTKRLRLLTGEHTGEIRMGHEYEAFEKVEHNDAFACLASVWML